MNGIGRSERGNSVGMVESERGNRGGNIVHAKCLGMGFIGNSLRW